LAQYWHACATDSGVERCWSTYNDMYVAGTDSLNVTLTAGNEWDGGVETRICRWGHSGPPFFCHLYDVGAAEGSLDANDPEGIEERTPLALPFLSMTTSNTKRAVWLRSTTGYDIEIVKAVPESVGARDSTLYGGDGWYNATGLQVLINSVGFTTWWWSSWGP
jgi:hypothetical protein